jgi:F-type H+-transporting ATPase subunit a
MASESVFPDPLHHVADTEVFEIFPNLGIVIPVPEFLTRIGISKFVILELIAAALILAIYIPLSKRVQSGKPVTGWFWNAFESLLTFMRNEVIRPNIGEHDADRFVPFLWTAFLYILFCNLMGMFPFAGSPTASISMTAGLALCVFVIMHGAPILRQGVGHYLLGYIPPNELEGAMRPLGAVIGIMVAVLELFSTILKSSVLAIRLFANMFAGHTTLAVILYFIVAAGQAALHPALFWPISFSSVALIAVLSLLELFIAFLQAYVFVFLSSIFIGSTLHMEH